MDGLASLLLQKNLYVMPKDALYVEYVFGEPMAFPIKISNRWCW